MTDRNDSEQKLLIWRIKVSVIFLIASIISCLEAKYVVKENFDGRFYTALIALMLIFLGANIGAYTGWKQADDEIKTEWWKYRDKP